MQSQLPQHSLEAFRRYERDIAAVIDRYPKETLLYTAPFSPITYICRFRDAVNSMGLNSWTSELFTLQDCNDVFKFRKQGGTFILTHGPERTVRVGPSRATEAIQSFAASASLVLTFSEPLNGVDNELFLAVVTLKERDLLKDRVAFINLTPSQIHRLEESPVIAYDEDPPGTHLIL